MSKDPAIQILGALADAIAKRGKLTIRYGFKEGHKITFGDLARIEKAIAKLLTSILFPDRRRVVPFFLDVFSTVWSEEEKRENRIDIILDFDQLLTQMGVPK